MDILEESTPQNFFQDKNNIIATFLFLGGLFVLAVGAGLVFFRSQAKDSDVNVELINASPMATVAGVKTGAEITIDVDGAVVAPGLYKLPSDSRVNDAITAAGGLDPNAQRAQINLAAKLVDGQKIHIAAVGEIPETGFGKLNQQEQVNINSASQAEIESLSGVGPVTAVKIITARPYAKIEELVSKKAVSKSVFDKIRDQLSL